VDFKRFLVEQAKLVINADDLELLKGVIEQEVDWYVRLEGIKANYPPPFEVHVDELWLSKDERDVIGLIEVEWMHSADPPVSGYDRNQTLYMVIPIKEYMKSNGRLDARGLSRTYDNVDSDTLNNVTKETPEQFQPATLLKRFDKRISKQFRMH
jgi:hypothetical protein